MINVSNGFVERVQHNNDDLTAVNAARVSFAKTSSEIDQRDIKLINYLARHDHWTPFSHVRMGLRLDIGHTRTAMLINELGPLGLAGAQWHLNNDGYLNLNMSLYGWAKLLECSSLLATESQFIVNEMLAHAEHSTYALVPEAESASSDCNSISPLDIWLEDDPRFNFVTFRLKMPIAIARQWFKHQIGLTRNEVSRRYVSDTPEFFVIDEWRGAPTNGAKQGSSEPVKDAIQEMLNTCCESDKRITTEIYAHFIERGVCAEQLRFTLPQAMLTEFWETGSLSDYARICKLRLDPHAQKEVRDYAKAVDEVLTNSPDLASIWKNAKGV